MALLRGKSKRIKAQQFHGGTGGRPATQAHTGTRSLGGRVGTQTPKGGLRSQIRHQGGKPTRTPPAISTRVKKPGSPGPNLTNNRNLAAKRKYIKQNAPDSRLAANTATSGSPVTVPNTKKTDRLAFLDKRIAAKRRRRAGATPKAGGGPSGIMKRGAGRAATNLARKISTARGTPTRVPNAAGQHRLPPRPTPDKPLGPGTGYQGGPSGGRPVTGGTKPIPRRKRGQGRRIY